MGLTKDTEEDAFEDIVAFKTMMAYAMWAKFVESSMAWLPWATAEEIPEPTRTVIGEDENGIMYETVVRITHRGFPNEKTE